MWNRELASGLQPGSSSPKSPKVPRKTQKQERMLTTALKRMIVRQPIAKIQQRWREGKKAFDTYHRGFLLQKPLVYFSQKAQYPPPTSEGLLLFSVATKLFPHSPFLLSLSTQPQQFPQTQQDGKKGRTFFSLSWSMFNCILGSIVPKIQTYMSSRSKDLSQKYSISWSWSFSCTLSQNLKETDNGGRRRCSPKTAELC